MSTAELEQRLIAIEREVARLKAQQHGAAASPAVALERIHGSFEDDSAFREAARLGRKWRLSDRRSTPPRKSKARKK